MTARSVYLPERQPCPPGGADTSAGPGPGRAQRVKQLFDPARDLTLADCWSCYTDITPDMLPVLGPAPAIEGLTITTGISGHGFAVAPIVGKVGADSALGEDPGFDLDAFSAARW